ncbi:hypothetical protein E4U19_002897 [Claviceps sp. Clav32 group G5]|nr:hypothetical protein E4U19_002897 [Claviceps sp. Clav32 group G5]
MEDNPIAHHLVGFHSSAGRKGVSDSAGVDELIAKATHGSLFDDLTKVIDAIGEDMIEGDCLRLLLKAAIIHQADDKTLWDVVFAFVTATLTATRPPAPRSAEPKDGRVTATQISTPSINVSEHHSFHGATISPDSTVSNHFQSPSKYTTGSVTSLSEHREDLNLLLKHKLKGRMDIEIPGFLDAFFPSSDYQQTADRFLDRYKAGVVPAFHNGWDTWPDGAAETEVVTWLKLITDELEEFSKASFSSDVSHRRAILGMPRKPSRGSVAMPELNVAFVSAADLERGPESLRSSCARMLARGELRRDPMADEAQETRLEPGSCEKCAGYADCTRHKAFCTRIHPLRIFHEGLAFIKVMLGFLWMSEEDLGFNSSIKGPDLTVEGADGKKRYIDIDKTDGNKECIVLDQEILRSSWIVGRATTCWKAHVKADPETILVVKDSWQEMECDEEGDMLLLATRKGVVNVARHYHHETVQARGMNDDVHACSSDRAPSERLRKRGTSTNPSTSAEEEGSGLHPRKKICSSPPTDIATEPRIEKPNELRNRVHRRVIVQDYGKAIYKASSRQALLACLEGCIKGHQSLYEAGILHRDISINNLMINEESETNQSFPYFLIDLDHAIKVDPNVLPNKRTKIGTRAFMAIDLLNGMEQQSFLHDLESFFWVLCWICIHYGKSGADSRISPSFDRWNYMDEFDLASNKANVLYTADKFIAAAEREFMPYYKPLIRYVNKLRELLPFVAELPWKIFKNTAHQSKRLAPYFTRR